MEAEGDLNAEAHAFFNAIFPRTIRTVPRCYETFLFILQEQGKLTFKLNDDEPTFFIVSRQGYCGGPLDGSGGGVEVIPPTKSISIIEPRQSKLF